MKPIILVIAGSALLLFSLSNRPSKTRNSRTRTQTARLAGGGLSALRGLRK